jgi:hypothetical protein
MGWLLVGLVIGFGSAIWVGCKVKKSDEKPRMVTWPELIQRAQKAPPWCPESVKHICDMNPLVGGLVQLLLWGSWAEGWIAGSKAGAAGQRYEE